GILIAYQSLDVVFDTLLGFSKTFLDELPNFRMRSGPVLRFGIQRGCCDGQQVFADHLDPVLPTLIVSKRLAMEQHGVEDRPCEPPTRTFHEDQFGAYIRMSELRVNR